MESEVNISRRTLLKSTTALAATVTLPAVATPTAITPPRGIMAGVNQAWSTGEAPIEWLPTRLHEADAFGALRGDAGFFPLCVGKNGRLGFVVPEGA
jgi:hypothetical protein